MSRARTTMTWGGLALLGTLVALVLLLAGGRTGGQRGASPTDARLPRVVVLSPAAGIILTDLGLRDAIVARHAYDAFLPESLPIAGDQSGIDYEPLLRTQPTHVVTQWGSRELPARLTDLAQRQGWRVLDVRLLTMTDVAEQTLALDQFVRGSTEPSRRATDLARRAHALSQPAPAAIDGVFAGRVLLLASLDPPAALGPGSCHHDILLSLGGLPALREGRPWMELTSEDLLLLAPEAIVLVRPHTPGEPRADDARRAELFADLRELAIPAVRTRRLALLDDPRGLLPSTAMIPLSEDLDAVLRRWGAEAASADGTSGVR